jgi:hypothetical protein
MLSKSLLYLSTLALALLVGCGASKQRLATEQLVVSDSVDRAVAKIDFSPLSGRKAYLETKYLLATRPPGYVSPEYVVSSLRQQMMAYGLLLQDKPEEAEVIVEARCGTLGSDGHDSSFGIPAGNAVSAAASTLGGMPFPPILPEISLAKRMDNLGATKVAVFAYDKTTKEPLWQSGISTQISTAKDFFVLGVGPFQRGAIYGGTRFAGDPLKPFDPVAFTKRLPDPVAALRGDFLAPATQQATENTTNPVEPAGFQNQSMAPTPSPMGSPPMTPQPNQPPPENLKWAPVPPR